MVRAVLRVSLSALRHRELPGHHARAAPGARAVARAGRGSAGAAPPRATSIRRSSACRSRSSGMTGNRFVVDLQRPAAAARAHRRARGIRRRRALPRVAAALGAASHHRRAHAAGVRPCRPVERPLAGRLHLPRRPIPAGATTSASRSTPTRRRRGAWRASRRTGTPRARWPYRPERPSASFPLTLDLRRAPDYEGALPFVVPHGRQQGQQQQQ